MTVTSGLHRQKDDDVYYYIRRRLKLEGETEIKKDKERQKRKEIDVRWWPQEPESGGEAQARARLARDCGLPLPKT